MFLRTKVNLFLFLNQKNTFAEKFYSLNPHPTIVNKKQSIVNKNINVCFAISKNSYIFAMYFIINEFFRWQK